MSEQASHALAEFLCSSQCHDLANTIGSISNYLELIEEHGAEAETLTQLRASVDMATGRLKFFRLAFGAAGNAATEDGFDKALDYARSLMPQRTTLAA